MRGGVSGHETETSSSTVAPADWWRTYAGTDATARDSAIDVAVDARGRATVLASLAQRAFGVLAYNADGTLAWASTYHDPSDQADLATKVAIDASGNVYAAGSWQRVDTPLGGFLVVSFDAAGALRWSARTDGGGALSDLSVDGAGHVVVTGGGSDGMHSLARTVAYDGGGHVLWQASELGPLGLGAMGRHVVLDADANAYVAGESSDGTYNQVTLFAYDVRGASRWATRGGDDPEHVPQTTAQALALDAAGEPHVAIAQADRTAQDAEPTVELAVRKYDVAGRTAWTARVNQAARNIATAIAVDAEGRVTVTGFTGSPTPDSYLTAQFDAAGQLRWMDRFGWYGPGEHQACALTLDGAGDAYVTGTAYRADGVASFGSIAYDPEGGVLFRELDGDAEDRTAAALALDRSGALYVVGSAHLAPRGVVGVLRSSR
ncbi:MAG TPA: hypothetical protein VKU41_32025 [Polyangiaceae bacterium]|nr:hypothetical protein [Polyangiaceae bacterium]